MPSQYVAQYLQRPYARVIMPDNLGRYAAQILEFPGCFSEGATPEEAYSNLEEAAENWLESALSQGMAIPEPFAVQGYSGTVSLRLPKSIHRRAAEYAHKDGVSLNQFLVSAIAARVGAEDLLSVIASKLDERLDRLDRRRTRTSLRFLAFDSEEEATTPQAVVEGTPVYAWVTAGHREFPEVGKLLKALTLPPGKENA